MRDINTYCMALKKAVRMELSREKSYGCVNFWSTGSHDDMDYKTILTSLESIIYDLENAPWSHINNFDNLRQLGLRMEANMYQATNGVNTYKGLIFLQLFLVYTWFNRISWDDSPSYIEGLASPLLADYKSLDKAKSYKVEKLKDIRHFPLNGFREIFDMVSDLLIRPVSDHVLTLSLIAQIDDTTTVARSSVSKLRQLQSAAGQALSAYQSGDLELFEKLSHDLNEAYLKDKISSGGVADIFTTIRTLEILRNNNDY